MPDPLHTIHVELGERSYNIDVGYASLPDIGGRIVASQPECRHVFVITDTNVGPLYEVTVQDSLAAAGIKTDLLTVAAGEPSKCVAQAEQLWQALLAGGADRRSCVVALGGGVIGDLAGFVAATFARGVALVQIPTTLLAQVDSSVGGKVGINMPDAKNMVGCFWQPAYVGIDLAVLDSLPPREFAAGMAEVIKYGVIQDAKLFELLENETAAIAERDQDVLSTIVARCCQLKSDVVQADEREESGRRAVLNYGHTFAHALEASTEYSEYLHGEAVSIGIMCAARLAEQLGMITPDVVARQETLLTSVHLPTGMPQVDADHFLKLMRRDKKAAGGQIRLVLPDRLGNVVLRDDVDEALIKSVL